MSIEIERTGRRSYLLGNTYAYRQLLRDAGAHFDGDRRAWWIGSGEQAQALLAKMQGAESAPDAQARKQAEMLARDAANILGRATYQGKSYYLVGEGQGSRGPWVRLLFRDGSKTFFADAGAVSVSSRYQRPKSLDSLRQYAERMRRETAGGECECSCHRNPRCTCETTGHNCPIHFDGCDRCGCEADW